MNTSSVSLPWLKAKRVGSSIRRPVLSGCLLRCWSLTRAGFLTRAAAAAGCLCRARSLFLPIATIIKTVTTVLPSIRLDRISIFGQESNQTTWRLCKMNLAIRGIDSSNVKWNNEGSFLNDAHPDLKADFVIANPPFNDKDWSGDLLRTDGRWQYGVPPVGNANYAWIQHFLYHLSKKGTAGFVLAKGSLSSKTNGEGDIRKNLIEAKMVDCIVNLPTKLFLNTQIPACLWFLSKDKANGGRNRRNEILFIDARNMGTLINRRNRELTGEDIERIAATYHNWKAENADYADIPGFCKSATLDEVRALDYVLTPGRYIGLPDDEDDFNFEERVRTLTTQLAEQMRESAQLDERIKENLQKIGVEI